MREARDGRDDGFGGMRLIVKFGLIWALLATGFLPAHGQSTAYELSLGMHINEMRRLMGPEKFDISTDERIPKEVWWKSENIDLAFCNDRLSAFRIALNPSLASFTRAVKAEISSRGDPKYELKSAAVSGVEAETRLEPYRYLRISITQYQNGETDVSRWQTQIGRCE